MYEWLVPQHSELRYTEKWNNGIHAVNKIMQMQVKSFTSDPRIRKTLSQWLTLACMLVPDGLGVSCTEFTQLIHNDAKNKVTVQQAKLHSWWARSDKWPEWLTLWQKGYGNSNTYTLHMWWTEKASRDTQDVKPLFWTRHISKRLHWAEAHGSWTDQKRRKRTGIGLSSTEVQVIVHLEWVLQTSPTVAFHLFCYWERMKLIRHFS